MSHNGLVKINIKDLLYLKNLKYLSVANNLIESIQKNSLDSLINLETLSFASNNLANINRLNLFDNLLNLKELNLSLNMIEILDENLFYNLNKLVTIDLSFNKIFLVKNYALNSLFNLKNLNLYANSARLVFESALSFSKLESLANIYVSKSILETCEENKCFFKTFAQLKNTKSLRTVLKRKYYYSINLLALTYNNTLAYNCNLTLSFIQYNIHYNFKSDLDLFYYVNQDCEPREILKTQFYEFRICPNNTEISDTEHFIKKLHLEILWLVLVLFVLLLILIKCFL